MKSSIFRGKKPKHARLQLSAEPHHRHHHRHHHRPGDGPFRLGFTLGSPRRSSCLWNALTTQVATTIIHHQYRFLPIVHDDKIHRRTALLLAVLSTSYEGKNLLTNPPSNKMKHRTPLVHTWADKVCSHACAFYTVPNRHIVSKLVD